MIFVICISGFAYRIGTDSIFYQYHFQYEVKKLSDCSWSYLNSFLKFQPGYVLFETICKSISDSYYLFKFIYATIINSTIFFFIHKHSNYLFMGILAYLLSAYLYFNFEIYRECLSICVFIWSLKYLYTNQWFKYYSMVLLAISLHYSALILLFVPLLIQLKASNKILVGFYILSVLIMTSEEFIKPYVADFLTYSAVLEERYSGYLESDTYGQSILSFSKIFSYVINIIIPPLMVTILYKKNCNKEKYYSLIYFSATLLLLSQIIPILGRFNNYFKLYTMLFYIDMFYYWAKKISAKKVVFISLFIAYYFSSFVRNNSTTLGETGIKSYIRYYPYASIFSMEKNNERESLHKY